MNFKELLLRAQAEDQQAKEKLLSLYQPLLMKEAVVNGVFDEDVYQELCITLLTCIKRFKV
ncbi:helix-turn-helix domain-containing protein [Intestinimonas butyriciproducens]|uniref:helix-turn-helix domain-containing protein n=1 Tax=Intestinimonas butyriciproducens TaxID=1297617 RepID=UPI001958EDAD|nr:helix-turn-helix domain-containing protein [Intestinimonas butyriciproducens]MBM6917769.1 helix-turn-helix domain-containing protein [Intestinimonas butyriciproducens]